MDRQGIVKVIYFGQGDLACASSNAEEDRLGNLLVRTGRLSPEQLAHAKSRQSEKASIGNTLVELGYITAAELLEGARRQVEEIVADLVGWREGAYQVRASALSREVVNLSLPARAVLVRALQHTQDRELLVERLGSMEAVLARNEPFEEAARGFDFGFPAEPVLTAINGRNTVREICEAVDLEDFQACKVLYTLLTFGLLRRTSPVAPRELLFVEGELQNGEKLARADEIKPRWGRRRAAREQEAAPAQTAPIIAVVAPPAPEPESEESAAPALTAEPAGPVAGPAEPMTEAIEPAEDDSAPAEIDIPMDEADGPAEAAPTGRPSPLSGLVWRGAAVSALLALVGGILYFTYFRPTLSPGDAEEARLLAALMDEAEREAPPEPAPGAPATKGPAARSVPPNQNAEPPAPTRKAASAPATSQGTSASPPSLENARAHTMLSADANFRSAIDLIKDQRFPEAAELFGRALQEQSPGSYSIQVLLACQDSTLERAFERAPNRTLYFVSTTFRGQSCYRLLDGLYPSEMEARRELERLPAFFREDGNLPTVVRAPGR